MQTPFADRCRVLLIDDDDEDYLLIRSLLDAVSSARYDLVWRSSPRAGLEAMAREEFDACLLDYRLGEQSGLELLKEARSRVVGFPVIFLTGMTDFQLDVKAMEGGAADYLVKSQLTAPLLERSIRYAIKHAKDLRELRESRERLLQQERLASLGLLASGLAHEIGTPLGIIRSRAEMAAKKAEGQPAIQKNVIVVIEQIDRISRVIHSLLHFARGRATPPRETIGLRPVIEDVLELTRPEFERRGILLALDADADAPVRADAGLLAQVLMNLLLNAIHAIEEADRPAKGPSRAVKVRTERRGADVVLSVEDTGVGIPEELMGQLFRPFFSTKAAGCGTGLGLATSAGIIQAWGGSISVESAVGRGSRFTVAIPIQETLPEIHDILSSPTTNPATDCPPGS